MKVSSIFVILAMTIAVTYSEPPVRSSGWSSGGRGGYANSKPSAAYGAPSSGYGAPSGSGGGWGWEQTRSQGWEAPPKTVYKTVVKTKVVYKRPALRLPLPKLKLRGPRLHFRPLKIRVQRPKLSFKGPSLKVVWPKNKW